MKILGTGLTGLVGSRIVSLLPEHSFENLSRQSGVDIQNRDTIYQYLSRTEATIVLHAAAKTQVDECEKEKSLGKESESWRVNVLATQHIVSACKEFNKKLIYFSTDFVFDGENPKDGYIEEDTPNPINWYGFTKREGEKIVENSSIEWVIARIAYPYAYDNTSKDFVRVIMQRLKNGQPLEMITDHIMTPTFINDIAQAIKVFIENNNTNGIFHIAGSQFITPYDASLEIAKVFGFNSSLIKKTTRERFFQGRAPRPFQLKLKNDKIQQLGVLPVPFVEGLKKVQI